jgi:2-polyprenyl-6-methoxyphenol hydroxylase-like FAD-dependent oxidoreductase
MRVLVIGGGLGGLCLAQGLRKAQIDVAVYEREASPEPPPGERYTLSINNHGNQALHACLPDELWQVYRAASGEPVAGLRFMTEHMRPLVSLD